MNYTLHQLQVFAKVVQLKKYHKGLGRIVHDPAGRFHSVKKLPGSV